MNQLRVAIGFLIIILLTSCGWYPAPIAPNVDSYEEQLSEPEQKIGETIQEVLDSLPSFNDVSTPNIEEAIAEGREKVWDVIKDELGTSTSERDEDDNTGFFLVQKVIDGDTVKVTINGKPENIRFLLVDAPEVNDKEYGLQPYAKEATEFVVELLEGKQVKIIFGLGKNRDGRDDYDRLLGYLYDDQCRMVNKLLLEKGFARVAYVFEPDTEYANEFRAIEKVAKEDNTGIWSIDGYVKRDGFHGSVEN